jgi:outer membrane protein insertion porin family
MSRLALLAFLAAAACGGTTSRAPLPDSPSKEELGPPARLEDLKGNVVAIEVTGMSKERAARARDGVKKGVGTPFDRGHVAGWMHFVASLSGVADVIAEARPVKGGVAVRLVVKEHPTIRSVDVRGSNAVPATEWLSRMGIKAGDYLDPALAASRRSDMVETLQSFGHFSANVNWGVEKAPDGRVDLVFTVEEGPAVTVSKIDFKGLKAVKRDVLLDILSKNGGTTVGQRYWRQALSNAMLFLTNHYYDRGYINVQIDTPTETLSADKSKMALTLTIREGDRFRVGKLDAKGTLVVPAAEYVKLLGIKPGEIFNRSKIATGLEKINEMHKSKGREGMNVYPSTQIDPNKKTIGLTLEVQGPAPAPKP